MDILIIATFVVSLLSSIMSGMGGGGGGFIVMPYLIFIGLPPAQALATAKFGGLGVAGGALAAFKGKGYVNKKLLWPLISITFMCALVSAWFVPQIDPVVLEKFIGVILLLAIPTLFMDHGKLKPGPRSRPWIIAGFIVYALFTIVQTTVGTGMGALITIALMLLFGLNALSASATMRVPQAVQAVVLFILLAIQGLVVWAHGVAMLLGTVFGTFIGTKIAIKKGHSFVKLVLAGVMLVSGVALLVL
jgi:uncharacterized membrane protein YfcA